MNKHQNEVPNRTEQNSTPIGWLPCGGGFACWRTQSSLSGPLLLIRGEDEVRFGVVASVVDPTVQCCSAAGQGQMGI